MATDIPTITNRIAERLSRAESRSDGDALEFSDSQGSVNYTTPNDRSTVALALLVLKNLRDHGASRIPKRSVEKPLRDVLDTMTPKEIMDVEIETYELLLWIGKAIDPDWKTEIEPDLSDPMSNDIDGLVRWAINNGVDLELDYYARQSGELTHRKITPISFEAEKYMHAFCHLRHAERVFRISRIAELRPIGGWTKTKPKTAKKQSKPKPDQTDRSSSQIDLWKK